MARSRDPYNQALSALRAAIVCGRLRGGAPVIVATEAQRLALSITPVREALARLDGEHLVERAPGGGYLVVRLDAPDAVEGYWLLEHFLLLASGLTRASIGSVPAPPAETDARTLSAPYLFDRLVRGAGNGMLTAVHGHLRRRMSPLERAEAQLFDDHAEEAGELYVAVTRSQVAFEQAARAYYQRRIRAAATLVRLAEEEAPPD